jgi:hypothetical protein
MADVHGSPGAAPQMPAAPGAGPAPVPYGGGDQRPEPPVYGPPDGFGPGMAPGAGVLVGVSGNAVQESGYAHDVSAGLVTPYMPGSPSAIYAGGDSDAGGRDDMSGTVAGAVANAEARFLEHEADTHAQGSMIGDAMTIPLPPEDATAPPNDFLYPQGNQPGA